MQFPLAAFVNLRKREFGEEAEVALERARPRSWDTAANDLQRISVRVATHHVMEYGTQQGEQGVVLGCNSDCLCATTPLPNHSTHLWPEYTTARRCVVKSVSCVLEAVAVGCFTRLRGDHSPVSAPNWSMGSEIEVQSRSDCHGYLTLRGQRNTKLHVPGQASGKRKAELDPADTGKDGLGLTVG